MGAKGFLTHNQILEHLRNRDIVVEPLLNKEQINSASIDLRLSNFFMEFRTAKSPCIDPAIIGGIYKDFLEEVEIEFFRDCYFLQPKKFVLAQTFEYISLPDNVVGHLEGRSSVARQGLTVHAAAGLVDPGFAGHLVFELLNAGEMPLKLYPLMRVAKIAFYKTEKTKPYRGQYRVQVRIKTPGSDKELQRIIGIKKKLESTAKQSIDRI